jgi:flagellar M-ring protein FliF
MGFLDKINAVWGKIGIVQRALLFSIVIACIITGSLLTKWATTADMRLLYEGLPPEEAGKVVDKIAEAGIEYKLGANGTSVFVPENKVYQLRLTMAREGLLKDTQGGYSIIDSGGIGVSPLVQQMNKGRAIQEEIAKSIQIIDGVVFAKVMLVMPESTMYASSSKEATASVMLRIKPGWKLSSGSIAAISHLVASSTNGLKPGNVTIVDEQGRLLTSNTDDNGVISSAGTFMDYKTRVERELADKVQNMLDTVLGQGRSTVKVNAKLDMTSTETMKTTFEKGAPQKVESTETSKETGNSGAEGEPAPANKETSEQSTTDYDNNHTITKTVDVPGDIVSLSVAAIVDLSRPKPPPSEEEGKEGETAAAETELGDIMTVEQVKEMIMNVLGRELLAGENALSVENVAFVRPAAPVMAEGGLYEKIMPLVGLIRHASMGIMAVCALLVLKIFAGGKKKADADSAGIEGQIAGGGMGLLPAPGAELSGTYKQQISTALNQNPEQVKQLFTSWITEES